MTAKVEKLALSRMFCNLINDLAYFYILIPYIGLCFNLPCTRIHMLQIKLRIVSFLESLAFVLVSPLVQWMTKIRSVITFTDT